MLTLNELKAEFREFLGIDAPANRKLLRAAESLLSALSEREPVGIEERERRLIALVNSKFDVNGPAIAECFAAFAKEGITFNYHQKVRIASAFDRSDKEEFLAALEDKIGERRNAGVLFIPASKDDTISRLKGELKNPTLVRKDSKPKDWSVEISESLFGGFVFSAFPRETVHRLLDNDMLHDEYEPDFWKHIHQSRPNLFSRNRSLAYLKVSQRVQLEDIAAAIAREFNQISNHGYLAIHFSGWDDKAWRASGYTVLFAEKFLSEEIRNSYFQHDKIERATRDHIPLSPSHDYGFSKANIGFQYKDTFVFDRGEGVDLLLLLQKNEPDETLIPCPCCRSHDVRGNSYSSIGVKSWECGNPLCPDRSKFNRGKRYSFLQLLKQQAIEDPDNVIPPHSVRAWARDVQPGRMIDEIVPMLLRHYSLAGDGVALVGATCSDSLGRRVETTDESQYFSRIGDGQLETLLSSDYFSRFAVASPSLTPTMPMREVAREGFRALLGESAAILAGLPEGIADGAMTSPPYYNAREYSQWSNIYCYLYDMYNNARMVYRSLKPGGYYLFNIFDYFDNENNIALSAMGEKRMILSAYCIDLFERAGFKCESSIVWDKGDIEGKRGFNGGNFSPYYQAPFNCWEHIIVFRKPGKDVRLTKPLPNVLRAKPVLKMVRGENRHGHTAPFPETLPRLLLDRLPTGSVVIDPYAGSMTTGRAAYQTGHHAICIEKDPSYFDLGVKMFDETSSQETLFDTAYQ